MKYHLFWLVLGLKKNVENPAVPFKEGLTEATCIEQQDQLLFFLQVIVSNACFNFFQSRIDELCCAGTAQY